ncbi:type VII secretion protein EccB [Cryptosporangium aurantiacum]|uniref:Type VII secretion protein EccB n=1 Tax=Cryptosporangium aurantiacum TaxID=134849 RepID=A0A1M7NHV3_9ACTN|nr:type VII secretion protein EccB [Cryptosporangium aurantiacum]SHN03340.1 type VII secretion protein EccB [Cryptosporangium aurantiacum]
MASRKDQLQSYQFLVQRFVSALIMRETDPAQVPFRRLAGAAFASVMVAVLALAGVGIYGLLRPGGDKSWQSGRAIVVEKETGTKFVVRDGVLHPVANYVSAVLIQGSTKTDSVGRSSLVGYPRGARLGIADAPDSLPAANQLLDGPWSLCMQPQKDDAPVSVLGVGITPQGGHELKQKAVVAQERGSGDAWLITNGRRFPITDQEAVLPALGLNSQPQLPVSEAWLGGLPSGDALGPLDLANIGAPTAARADARVGQVFVAESAAYTVATADELLAVTPLQAAIQLADDATEAAYPDGEPVALEIPANEAPQPKEPDTRPEAPPATAPTGDSDIRATSATCAAFSGAAGNPKIVVDSEPLASSTVTSASAEDAVLVDRVALEPGRAALVRALPTPNADSGTLYLISDDKRRHPLSSAEVAAVLGYRDVRPVDLPAALVERLPVGSELDPKAATRPVT